MNFSSLSSQYDLVVCGAGPGGLNAVLRFLELSKGRWSVALLDKRLPWREPVACAEAVHRQTLINLLGQERFSERWVRTFIDGVDFFSPDGTNVRFLRQGSGLILDRAAFHRDLAEQCAAGGAFCNYSTRVLTLSSPDEGGRRRVKVRHGESGEERELSARYVIDATGAGSFLGPIPGVVDSKHDLETGVFSLVKGLDHDPRFIQLHYGQEWAPGGYAWLFPRDGEFVSVGVVVDRAHLKTHPPRQLLDKLLSTRWKGAIPSDPQKYGGPISCGEPKGALGADGVFRVGDAASMVNPLSRGGILEAMKGGRYASEALIGLLEAPESRFEEAAVRYHQMWWEDKGKGHQQLARAKGAFGAIPDSVFDRAAHRLSVIPDEKRSLFRIFWNTLLSSPMLIWRLRSLLR